MGAAIITVVLAGTLAAMLPVDSGTERQSNATTSRPTTPVPSHALSGVVKSVSSTRLVITRAGRNPGEMTFVLSATTHREGPITVGATIQVRFRTEGDTQVATAILATPAKRTAAQVPTTTTRLSLQPSFLA